MSKETETLTIVCYLADKPIAFDGEFPVGFGDERIARKRMEYLSASRIIILEHPPKQAARCRYDSKYPGKVAR